MRGSVLPMVSFDVIPRAICCAPRRRDEIDAVAAPSPSLPSSTAEDTYQGSITRDFKASAPLSISAASTASRASGPAAPFLLNSQTGDPPTFEEILRVAGCEQMYESSDDAGPACLMARAEAGSVVPVEVLVEQDEI